MEKSGIIPKTATEVTHVVSSATPFYPFSDLGAPATDNYGNLETLKPGTQLISLEDSLGYEQKWLLVLIKNSNEKFEIKGYVLQNLVTQVSGTEKRPFISCNSLEQYQPDAKITNVTDWKTQPANIVWKDQKRGLYCVTYGTGQEVLPDDGLEGLLKSSLVTGLQIILKNIGKEYKRSTVQELQSKYYFFGRVEDYNFDIRNCSSLKVLVTLPMRYAESQEIKLNLDVTVIDETPYPGFVNGEDLNTDPDIANITNNEDEVSYQNINFSSYDDYKQIFDLLVKSEDVGGTILSAATIGASGTAVNVSNNVLAAGLIGSAATAGVLAATNTGGNGVLNACDTIFTSRRWQTVPEGINISFRDVILNCIKFKEMTDMLIYSNIPIEYMFDSIKKPGMESRLESKFKMGRKHLPSVLKKKGFNSAYEVINALYGNFNGVSWNGELSLKIDSTNLKLSLISFKNSKGRQILLSRNLLNYLNDLVILDKTSLNYIKNAYEQRSQENSTFFKISKYENTNPFVAAFNGFKNIDPSQKTPDELLTDFVKEYHYPKVIELSTEPLNLTDCAKDTYSLVNEIYFRKTREATNFWYNAIKKDIKQQRKYEGNFLSRVVNGVTKDRNLQIILGNDPIFQKQLNENPLFAITRTYTHALRDVNVMSIIAELIKCSTANLSLEEYQAILEKYNMAKQYIEQLSFSTICNPFLSAQLKSISGVKLPRMEIIDPDRDLEKRLEEYYIKALKDVLVASTREVLKLLMKNCMSDPNRELQPSGATPLIGNISDSLQDAENQADINNLVNDLFGSDELQEEFNQADKNPYNYPQKKKSPSKKKLSDLLEDFSCLLTTTEICKLLNGSTVSDDIYNSMIEIVIRRYPELASKNKLITPSDIRSFFSIIGSNIDLSICEIPLSQPDIVDCGCKDNTREEAQRAILQGKGAPDDIVDEILNDLQETEKINVEKAISYMDKILKGEVPKVPSTLCSTGPNGEIIPPEIMLAPSIESFKSLLTSLFSKVYDTFDTEASNWSKTTYSIESSSPQMMFFDSQAGKIKPYIIEIDDNKEYSKEDHPSLPSTSNEKKVIPSFLFNDILRNQKYEIINSSFSTYVDGNKQQQLDNNLIADSLIESVKNANKSLKEFLRILLGDINSCLLVLGAQTVAGASAIRSLNDLWKDLEDINSFMIILDSFLRDSTASLETEQYKKLLESIGSNNEQTSLFLNNSGVSLYLKICYFLRERASKIRVLVSRISSTLDSRWTGNLNETQLIKLYNECMAEFQKVESYYRVVHNSMVNYPDYNFVFMDNFEANTGKNDFSNKLYDKYKIQILKNNSPFIIAENYHVYEDELDAYVKTELKIDTNNPNKIDVYKKYHSLLNNTESEDYEDISNILLKSVIQSVNIADDSNLSNNPFLAKVKISDTKTVKKKVLNSDGKLEEVVETIPEVWKPITDYLALVLPDRPTINEKNCNIKPNYLDVDHVLNDAIKQKAASACIEQIVNDKVRENLPVDTDELQDLETNDSQNIILLANHTLVLRVYIHDILLRSIGTFGYYDPQFLRDNDLFIDYIANCLESEIKSIDNTYYQLLTSFLVKLNKNTTESDSDLKAKRNALKEFIKKDLRKNILPKMTKRILDDTNKIYNKEADNSNLTKINFDLKKYNNLRDLIIALKLNDIILEDADGIHFFIKDKNKKIKIFEGTIDQINDSNLQFKLFFEYLFPIKRYITCLFITNNLCTLTRKQVLNTFVSTKKMLRDMCKLVYTNGQPIVVSPSNIQDLANQNGESPLSYFILNALLTTPLKIAKGFIEVADPTVSVASTVYKIAKSFDDQTSPLINPAIGLPMATAATIGQVWMPLLAPFSFNNLNTAYYAGGLWLADVIEDSLKTNTDKQKLLAESILSNVSGEQCEDLNNNNVDKIKLDSNDFVIINRGK